MVAFFESPIEICKPSVAKERLAVCFKCEKFLDGKCQLCNCVMKKKAYIKDAKCGDGKW